MKKLTAQDHKLIVTDSDFEAILYLHVPFCKNKCYYCDFFSRDSFTRAEVKRIIGEMVTQYKYFRQVYKNVRFKTIYIGGGTPSILKPHELEILLEALAGESPKEFTIEVNPESINREFLQICEDRNINRLSLGVQTFNDTLLKKMNRVTTSSDSLRALELLEGQWKGEYSVDLISGFPGQTEEDLITDLDRIFRYLPGHISLYSLSIEEGTTLEKLISMKKIIPLNEALQEELWFLGFSMLAEKGYVNYEISNFARPGKESLHNRNYWQMNPYLGIGPAGVSTLPVGHKIFRISNPKDTGLFLKGSKSLWDAEYLEISPKDFLFENLLMGLRTHEGIRRSRFENRFGGSFKDFFPKIYKNWTDRKILENSESHLILTQSNRNFLNRHLMELYRDLENIHESDIIVTWPDKE